MINVNRLSEGVDYQFVPSATDNKAWNVRFLTGPFPETVIQFGTIQVDGTSEAINFDFTIVETPEENLSPDNVELQEAVGSVLFYVLEDSLTNGTAELLEREK